MRSPSGTLRDVCRVCSVLQAVASWRVVACSCCETCLSLTLSLSSVSMCRCGALAPSFRKYRSLLRPTTSPFQVSEGRYTCTVSFSETSRAGQVGDRAGQLCGSIYNLSPLPPEA